MFGLKGLDSLMAGLRNGYADGISAVIAFTLISSVFTYRGIYWKLLG